MHLIMSALTEMKFIDFLKGNAKLAGLDVNEAMVSNFYLHFYQRLQLCVPFIFSLY